VTSGALYTWCISRIELKAICIKSRRGAKHSVIDVNRITFPVSAGPYTHFPSTLARYLKGIINHFFDTQAESDPLGVPHRCIWRQSINHVMFRCYYAFVVF
jgi:hypothetical protein